MGKFSNYKWDRFEVKGLGWNYAWSYDLVGNKTKFTDENALILRTRWTGRPLKRNYLSGSNSLR